MIGFVIWSITALLIAVIGVCSLRASGPVGFFTFVQAPKVRDVRAYNRAVARIWFAFAAGMEILGLPLLYAEQNSPVFLLPVLGTPVLAIAAGIAYTIVENRYKE